MAINKNNPVPFKAVHPGYGLREELKARGLKQREFAKMIGVQPSHLNELIQGKRDISNAIASKLESSLGIPATSWLNLQYMYEYQNKAIAQRSAKEQEAKSETMAKAIDSLRANQSNEPSKWKEQAQWHVNNWGWVKHSTRIALKSKRRMSELGITQKQLAEKVGCSKEYISLIFKGKENLTLETISKLESALNFEIIEDAAASACLNEPSLPYGKKTKKRRE